MKFFTLERYNAWYEDYVDDGMLTEWDEYKRHLQSMRGVLSDEVLDLAKPSGMEDGLIVRVEHDRRRHELKLVMRCGDLIIGYYDLVVTYQGAAILPEHDEILARIARGTKSHRRHPSDLYRQELDVADGGGVSHRLMFHPGIWFEIRCKELHFKRIPKPSRRLPSYRDRYPGGP